MPNDAQGRTSGREPRTRSGGRGWLKRFPGSGRLTPAIRQWMRSMKLLQRRSSKKKS